MNLANMITQYRIILTSHLSRGAERTAFVEVVMILLVGILYGLYDPHQVAEELATEGQTVV